MVEKVTVPKEVAEALEYLRKEHEYTFADFMSVKNGSQWSNTSEGTPLNRISIETLATALLVGYEIEKSPEEKVREYYTLLKIREEYLENSGQHGGQHRQGWQSVVETLNLLGIIIEGVNG